MVCSHDHDAAAMPIAFLKRFRDVFLVPVTVFLTYLYKIKQIMVNSPPQGGISGMSFAIRRPGMP
jgi:hypothetical protein